MQFVRPVGGRERALRVDNMKEVARRLGKPMQHIPESNERLADDGSPLGGGPVAEIERRLEPGPSTDGMSPVRDWEVVAVCEDGNAWSDPVPQGEQVEVAGLHHPKRFPEPVGVETRGPAVVEVEKDAELVAGDVVAASREQDGIWLAIDPVRGVPECGDHPLLLGK